MNLQFVSLDRPLRTLLIAAPGPASDRSIATTLANLAVTMAQIEQRIIVVDGDLRQPSLLAIPARQRFSGACSLD